MASLNTRVNALFALIDSLAKRTPPAVREMSERAADGMPTQTIGAGIPQVRGYHPDSDEPPVDLTSVESAVVARWRIDADWYKFNKAVNDAAVALHTALNICDRYTEVEKPKVCEGGKGRDGAYDPAEGGKGWGTRDANGNPAECGAVVEKTGLCHNCYQREYNWRRRNGYPPRNQHLQPV